MLAEGKTPVINGDGTHTRDYVYVSDVVKANLLALESDFVGELNIGTQTEISTNEVFRKVVAEMNLDVEETHGPERPGEQVTSSLDASKAKEILGWEPEVDFDEGVKKVVAWYQSR
jgi:UDP-glucose 4-epimerase